MPRLVYRDRDHTYWLDGVHIPSVTQSLKLAGHIDARFYTPDAAYRGSLVHAVCEAIDRQDWSSPLAQIAASGRSCYDTTPYAEAYERFLWDCRPQYAEIERAGYHAELRYGARPDRIVDEMCGESGVLELKTGDPEPWHALQLALYQLVRPAGSRWVVYLRDTGRYRLERCTQADDYRTAIAAVLDAWKQAENWQLSAA